jgi:arsenate reductase-like glutaredoxin family protein
MSKRQSKRILQKRKSRERRNQKNRKALSKKRELRDMVRHIRQVAPLPEFRISDDVADDDVKRLVLGGIEKFEKTYVTSLSEDALGVIAEQHRVGWTALVNEQAARIDDLTRGQVERSLIQLLELELGNGILSNAPSNLVRRVLPSSCFTLRPGNDRHWDVHCRSLKELKTSHGTLYQSPHRPTSRLNGVRREIAFTRHALLQLADRITPHWGDHYIGQTYVFGFLYECTYFGKTTLSNGQPSLVVYNSCLRAGKYLRAFMRDLLNVGTDKELKGYYYIVGYCPVILDDGLAVAKTFLTPGYYQTPERRTLKVSGRAAELADVEQACDEGINVVSVSTSERTKTAIRWFHNHGVPQVKKIKLDVFKDMDGPYAWIMEELEDEDPTPASS